MKMLLAGVGVLSFLVYLAAFLALPVLALRVQGDLSPVLALALVTGAFFCSPFVLLLVFWGHRVLLPAPPSGRFAQFQDRGSMLWALNTWSAAVFLRAFQGILFLSPLLGYLVLRALGCELAPSSHVSSRTALGDVRKLHLGRNCIVGEFAHLMPAFMPRPGVLFVDDIHVGHDTLIGGYSHLGPGVRVGDGVIVQYAVKLYPNVQVGDGARIGTGSRVYPGARIGAGARLGRECVVGPGAVVAPGEVLPDGARRE